MNTHSQAVIPKPRHDAPLFASPWLALFFLLRRERTESRKNHQ